jgi:hypothetical protein
MKKVRRFVQMLLVLAAFLLTSGTWAQSTLLTQSWENGGSVPTGWQSNVVSGTNILSFVTTSSYPAGFTAFDGTYFVKFDSWTTNGGVIRLKMTTPISTVNYSNVKVDFAWLESSDYATANDNVQVQYSTDGTTWTTAGTFPRYNAVVGWKTKTCNLPAAAANKATLYVSFLFTSAYGDDCYLDLTHITAVGAGNVHGTVTNCYNGAVITGATVTIPGGFTTTSTATGYTLTGVPAQTQTITCTATGFVAQTQTVTVGVGTTATVNFCLSPIPATLNGVVTNAANGNPLEGVSVSVSGTPPSVTYTILNGSYSDAVYPGGASASVTYHKEGFIDTTITVAGLVPPAVVVKNMAMFEKKPAPVNFVAALNAASTAVNLNWGVPTENYVIIYDDGVAENWTVWATQGNMDAVKFTPISYPAKVTGAQVNIGTALNYPAGANPLVPFQFAVYDATGAGGTPGTMIGGPFDVATVQYGFNTLMFPTPVTVNSGNFYVVMIQGGNSPNAAGVLIDTTTQSLRSYAKFVTGSGPWVPGNGNFLIRAIVNGAGGPLFMGTNNNNNNIITASAVPGMLYAITPGTVTGVEGNGKYVPFGPQSNESLLGYQVWRLKQGEEATPAVWTSIGTPTTNSMVDNGWPSLACGPYKWAAKAQYTGNRWSTATFSNIVQKCWTASVTVNADLSCDSAHLAGVVVTLKNLVYTDTVYQKIMTNSGTVNFPTVWKGTYTLTVQKFGYVAYTQTPITIMGDMTFNVVLLQTKTPPTGLLVDAHTLHATWNAPVEAQTIFSEDFASGSFATNAWVVAGANWGISTGIGNAAPSAMFNWTPEVTAYSQTLTSKTIAGVYSPNLRLKYDIFLDNFGTTNVNQMAVELWDGTTWHTLKNYDNQGGSIAWTSEDLDIAAYTNINFKIRFRAYGDDSIDINNWNVDNIKIVAQGVTTGPNYCILGYNFYLNNVLDGFTQNLYYDIPPSHVHYGTTYQACVLAIYGSGYSTKSCYTFTSKFLYPPTNIAAVPVGPLTDAAYITWQKPTTGDYDMLVSNGKVPITTPNMPAVDAATVGSVVPGVAPQGSAPMSAIDAVLYDNGTIINSPGTGAGGADESVLQQALGLSNYGFGMQQTAGNTIADDFIVPTGSGWDVTKFTFFGYQTGSGNTSTFTGCYFRVYNGNPMSGGTVVWGDLTTNKMTATSWANIYRTLAVGGTTDRPVMKIECTVPAHHFAPGHYWVEWQTTGSGASGPWNPPITINGATSTGDAIQGIAGVFAAITDVGPQGMPFQITGTGGGTPDGLIGYNVYRDNNFLHFVNGPDSLEYYDLHLLPGHYCYDVSAKYDLTLYGFPGQFDESLVASNGPACVDIIYGYPLPFVEPWTQGNFTFQNWTRVNVPATQASNWSVNTTVGNAAPCADFSWQPMINTYDQSLVSPIINAGPYTCAKIWFDFDYKLVDRNATGHEMVDMDVYYDGAWHNKGQVANNGSVDWTPKHIDITVVKGKGFQVRFRATGAHSNDILHWYFDNINIYAMCKPATNLVGDAVAMDAHLNWKAPKCGSAGGNILNEGFESGLFPPQFFTQVITNTSAANTTWVQSDASAIWGVHTGAGSAGVYWSTTHQDEWLIAHNISVTGNLNFWSYAFQGSVNLDHYYVKISIDNGVTWTSVFDLSAMSAYPSSDGWNKWTTPYMVDMSTYSGQAVDIAWQAVDGDGLGLWYVWAIDDLTMGGKKIDVSSLEHVSNPYPNQFANSKTSGISKEELAQIAKTGIVHTISYDRVHGMNNADATADAIGYDIYRLDPTPAVDYVKINAAMVTDTFYVDHNLNAGLYHFFVKSVFTECTTSENSDTIALDMIVGINNITKGGITIYPNPATELVNITSTSTISVVEVMNYLGQVVYTNNSVENKKVQVNVTGFEAGVYFVKVTTTEGIKTSKITVTR